MSLRTGAEQLMEIINHPIESTADMVQDLRNRNGGGVAVVGNQTSIVGSTHLVDTLLACGVNVTKIFCPEHGFRGTAAAGAHIDNSTDPKTGLPIVSLYGKNKKPTPEQMADVDYVVFDLQDVGCRFYTYLSTLHYVMEACAERGIPLMVLDRPNPNGYMLDGPVLDTATCRSFVGMHPVPVVYGMTIGEYAQMINGEGWLRPDADRMPEGRRDACVPSGQAGRLRSQCDHPVPVVYGMTIGEYAQMINGEGWLRPDADRMPEGRRDACVPSGQAGRLRSQCDLTVVPMQGYDRHGFYQLPVAPSPNLRTAHAVALYPSLCFFEGTHCGVGRGTDWPFEWVTYGTDTLDLRSYSVGEENPDLIDLWPLMEMYRRVPQGKFFLKSNFFEKLAGTTELRKQIEAGMSEEEIRATWQPGLDEFRKTREKYLIY